jgi:hypothetical protein
MSMCRHESLSIIFTTFNSTKCSRPRLAVHKLTTLRLGHGHEHEAIHVLKMLAHFTRVRPPGLESYRFSTPFGYILPPVESITKAFRARATCLYSQTLHSDGQESTAKADAFLSALQGSNLGPSA